MFLCKEVRSVIREWVYQGYTHFDNLPEQGKCAVVAGLVRSEGLDFFSDSEITIILSQIAKAIEAAKPSHEDWISALKGFVKNFPVTHPVYYQEINEGFEEEAQDLRPTRNEHFVNDAIERAQAAMAGLRC